MILKINKPFWQVLGLGTLAGMRSTAAPAITSHILSHHHSANLEHSALNFMQSEKVANALKALVVTELVGDKLPATPNRIKASAVTVRAISGALAGASIYKANGGKALFGALLGGSAAIASTFASFYIRKYAVKHTTIIDPIVGGIEDALVIGSGYGLTQSA